MVLKFYDPADLSNQIIIDGDGHTMECPRRGSLQLSRTFEHGVNYSLARGMFVGSYLPLEKRILREKSTVTSSTELRRTGAGVAL
jgi:hypothetical protein